MSKFTKSLALGFAATVFVAASAVSVYACSGDRLGHNGSGQGPTYNGQSYSGQFGNQAGGQLGRRMGSNQGYGGQGHNGPGSQLGNNNGHGYGGHGPSMQQSTSDSLIFEIVDKEGCTTDACSELVLQDANGHRIQVGAIEFDDGLTADTSLEELTYHLAQNGSAIKGRLELGGQDGDESRKYNLLVEQIYS